MIELKILIDKEQLLKELKVSGHSGQNKKGLDIVCAAISVLVYTLVYTIKKYNIKHQFSDDGNVLLVKIEEVNNSLKKELQAITLFFINGVKLTEKSYNKNIKITLIQE